MIKVELSANSYEELKEAVAKLAVSMGMGGFTEAATPPVEAKKPSKAKEKKLEPVKEEKIEPPVTVTLDVATAMLKKVNDAKGLPTAREVLTAFGANRLSEIAEDKYADVIAECEKRLV